MSTVENKNRQENDEITIKGLVDIFLPKIWLIALLAILFAGAFGFYSYFLKDDTYTSTAKFVMVKVPTKYNEEVTNVAQNTGINANEISAMQSLIEMAEQVMKTDDFLGVVKEELVRRDEKYVSLTIGNLKSMLSITLDGEGTVFDLKCVSTSSRLSYDVTEVVFSTLPDVIKDVFDSYAIMIKDIQTPREASSPNSKNTTRNAILGCIAGAFLGFVTVFVISKLDVAIRTKEKIEANFDIPVIGVIPNLDVID